MRITITYFVIPSIFCIDKKHKKIDEKSKKSKNRYRNRKRKFFFQILFASKVKNLVPVPPIPRVVTRICWKRFGCFAGYTLYSTDKQLVGVEAENQGIC